MGTQLFTGNASQSYAVSPATHHTGEIECTLPRLNCSPTGWNSTYLRGKNTLMLVM